LVERYKKLILVFNSRHVFAKDLPQKRFAIKKKKKKKKRFATGICPPFTQDWIALTFNF
jgi:hypothetical protein